MWHSVASGSQVSSFGIQKLTLLIMSSNSRPNGQRSSGRPNISSRQTSSGSGGKWGQAAQAAERGGDPQWMQDERYNDSEFLDNETKRVQGESAMSTRRALNRLNEASNVAQDNLMRLNSQSEQLYKMERGLEETKHTAKVEHD
jgi:hypothetical protein